MFFISFLAILLGLVAAFPLDSVLPKGSPLVSKRSIDISSNVASIKRVPGTKHNSARLQSGQAPLIAAENAQEFLIAISFGNQSFEVVADTGSSDTWLATTGFTCVNQTDNATLTEADCYFGPLFNSAGIMDIADENFNITYGDGEYLNGYLAYDAVTLAGVTVPKQEVAVVNLAAWDGDGISSGLVGLAFPNITSAYFGTNISADNISVNHAEYSSIINTIFEVDNLTAPMFAFAISRDESNTTNGGVFSLGGVPDVAVTSGYYSAPFEVIKLTWMAPTTEFQYYTIPVQGIAFEDAYGDYGVDTEEVQYIVDTGTTLLYIPTDDAIAYNSLWNPPAYGYEEYGIFYVNCTATPAQFAVEIGGGVFDINPLDLVLFEGTEDGESICVSGIQDAGDPAVSPNILGDVFLKNVLAVFDWGKSEMHFAAREFYSS